MTTKVEDVSEQLSSSLTIEPTSADILPLSMEPVIVTASIQPSTSKSPALKFCQDFVAGGASAALGRTITAPIGKLFSRSSLLGLLDKM